ncbi:hypothetical protein GYB57_14275 [bacterium]|nr:hypothetical protein [bacterium]
MENKKSFKLIEGQYDTDDAGRILVALISNKIKYHDVEAFRIQERSNGNVSHSEKRVKELTAVKEQIKQLVLDAAENGLDFKIRCDINIELVPAKQLAQ